MKQPLMLIPPAQAEALSDSLWQESGRGGAAPGGSQAELRFAPLHWSDDDLPDEEMYHPDAALPGEAQRRQRTLRAA